MGDRLALTEFWEKQSHAPTIETMMLNKLAEQVDEQDKRDILESLPDLDDMRIVELGAGIGRFTPILASKAEHVIVADIVESFIEVNRKNNEHLGNITFQTGEASEMKVDANSIHLLFTNWLLMYLTDVEVIRLLKNALTWLSVGGYLHIRESCSEPSKRNSFASTPSGVCQSDLNPTHYRHICQYLNLLNAITFFDSLTNETSKFKILWSKSVNTYVEAYGNWRQLQILVKKVAISTGKKVNNSIQNTGDNLSILLKAIKSDTIAEQTKFDALRGIRHSYFHERCFLSRFIIEAINNLNIPLHSVLNLVLDDRLSVSPFELSEAFDSSVCCIETNPYAYNFGLAEAVNKQDKRVRFYFMESVDSSSGEEMVALTQDFDLVIACRLTTNVKNLAQFFSCMQEHLTERAKFVLLEETDNEDVLKQNLLGAGFRSVETEEVTSDLFEEATKWIEVLSEKLPKLSSFYQTIIESNKTWFLVEVQ